MVMGIPGVNGRGDKTFPFDFTGDQLRTFPINCQIPFFADSLMVTNNTAAVIYLHPTQTPSALVKTVTIPPRYTMPVFGWFDNRIFIGSNGVSISSFDSLHIDTFESRPPLSPAGLLGSGPSGVAATTYVSPDRHHSFGYLAAGLTVDNATDNAPFNLRYWGYRALVSVGAGSNRFQEPSPDPTGITTIELRTGVNNGDTNTILGENTLDPGIVGRVCINARMSPPSPGPPYLRFVYESTTIISGAARNFLGVANTVNWLATGGGQIAWGIQFRTDTDGTQHYVVTNDGTTVTEYPTGMPRIGGKLQRYRIEKYLGGPAYFYVDDVMVLSLSQTALPQGRVIARWAIVNLLGGGPKSMFVQDGSDRFE